MMLEQVIFGRAAILRALLLFNILFAAQTVLDGAYSGAASRCRTA